MLLLYGGALLSEGDNGRGMAMLELAMDATRFQTSPRLMLISLVRYSF